MNVLVRKISLNRLENLQKLPVYGKSPHQRQLRGEACILHYGMSRQKQIPNLLTLANLPVFKKGELASKKKKKKKKKSCCLVNNLQNCLKDEFYQNIKVALY